MMYPGQLIIKPVSAQLTYDTEWFGSMDCFARITVGSNMFRTGVAHDQGKHPNWQDTFTAYVNGEQSMHVAIFDRDNMTDNDYVGECMVTLMDVYQRGNVSNWYPLRRRDGMAGQVMIMLQFIPQGGMGMGMGMPGMGANMNMGMPGMGMPGMGMGYPMNPGMQMGMGPGMYPMNPGMGGMGPGMGPGMGGMGPGMGPFGY